MRLLSVNVGTVREVMYRDRVVSTGIFKYPVQGTVVLRRDNIDGDAQADLRAHGGADKALYAYPIEHYGYWAERLGQSPYDYGHFGENLTLEGMTEDSVFIGDTFRVNTALLQVAQPRSPCFKLDLRMGVDGFCDTFIASNRVGFYLRVLQEGTVFPGADIEFLRREGSPITVAEAFALRFADKPSPQRLKIAIGIAALADNWRASLQRRLEKEG